MPEMLIFVGLAILLLLASAWADGRANRRRPIPRWDGTDQAHPHTLAAQSREFERSVERLAREIKRMYPG